MTVEEAIKIVLKNKKKDENIYGAVQTDELFIVTVDTEENIKTSDVNTSEYVWTVNKNTGEYKSIDLAAYADLVDDGKIQKVDYNFVTAKVS